MHTIRVGSDQPSKHRSMCDEGDFVSNAYPDRAQAYEKGLRHKERKEGDPHEGHKDIG